MDPNEIEREMRRTRAAIGADLDAIAERTRLAKEQGVRAVPIMLLAVGTLIVTTRWWRHRSRQSSVNGRQSESTVVSQS